MTIAPIPNERALIEQISKGDEKAFTILFDGYYKSLGSYVFRLTESMEAAEEIVQDVFVNIWQKKATLPEVKNLCDYLFILSRNKTLNYLRKHANQQIKFQIWEKEFGSDLKTSESESNMEPFYLLVDIALDQLPPQQKKVFQMSRVQRLKYDEIAKQLNLSTETIKKHIHLASNNIKAYIKNNLDRVVLIILILLFIFFEKR